MRHPQPVHKRVESLWVCPYLGDHLGVASPVLGTISFETRKMGGKCLEYCSVPSYKALCTPSMTVFNDVGLVKGLVQH